VAHNYGEVKPETLWNTAVERIPELAAACSQLTEKLSQED
jgi:uncharacterized protein with HEPN domain